MWKFIRPILYLFTVRATFYIKTFRSDKVYVRSAKQRKVIKKSNFQKFQHECKLQITRRNDYTNYLFKKDNFITDFIKKIVLQEEAKNELLALFCDEITRDINGVNKTWTKKSKQYVRSCS